MSLRTDRWKLIVNLTLDEQYLFDIQNDPQEKHDMSSVKPDVLKEMRDQIDAKLILMEKEGFDTPIKIPNQQEIERLKSLGYLSLLPTIDTCKT